MQGPGPQRGQWPPIILIIIILHMQGVIPQPHPWWPIIPHLQGPGPQRGQQCGPIMPGCGPIMPWWGPIIPHMQGPGPQRGQWPPIILIIIIFLHMQGVIPQPHPPIIPHLQGPGPQRWQRPIIMPHLQGPGPQRGQWPIIMWCGSMPIPAASQPI